MIVTNSQNISNFKIQNDIKVKSDSFINTIEKSEDKNQKKDSVALKDKNINKVSKLETNSFNFVKEIVTNIPSNASVNNNQVTINNGVAKISTINVKATSFINKLEKQEQKNNQPNYVQVNIDKAIKGLEDIKTNKNNSTLNSNEIPLDFIYSISDALTKLEGAKTLSKESLNEINSILGKVTTQERLNDNELKKLKEFSINVSQNADKLGLDPSQFDKLSLIIDGVAKARQNVVEKREQFNVKANALDTKMEAFLALCKDPNMNLDSNFVSMAQNLAQKYKSIKDSGNEVSIAMFSAYLDKVFTTMQDIKSGKETNSGVFINLQNDYEKSVSQTFMSMAKGQKPSLTSKGGFFGNFAPMILKAMELQAQERAAKTGISTSDAYKAMSTEIKNDISFTPSENKIMYQVKVESVKNAMDNSDIFSMISDLKENTNDIKESIEELNVAQEELFNFEEQIRNFINSDDFKKSFDSIIEDDSLDTVLDVIASDLISTADKLESSINFEISPSENISGLLKKLRDIISELEYETKKVNQIHNEKKRIDNKHSKEIEDNKINQEKLTQKRDELKREFILAINK
jgi:hypothetical protein